MEKTYVFDTDNSGVNSSALISALLNNKSIDPNLMAMLTSGNRNQDAWGGGCWWIWIILMFWLWGGNGNMFGRNGFGNGIPAELNNDFGRDILLQAINGNGTAISQLASTLNCDVNSLQSAICNVQSAIQGLSGQVGMSSQQIINSVQSSTCQLSSQISSCCCDVTNAITKSGYDSQLATISQTDALRAAGTANTNAIIAKLDQMQTQSLLDKIDALRERNTALTTQLNNEHQTAAVLQGQAASVAPINASLSDLSNRLAAIECKQPATVTIPYVPAMSNLIPVSYSQPVSLGYNYSNCYC